MYFQTRSADRGKILPRDRKHAEFYNAGPKKLGGLLPLKNLMAKHVAKCGAIMDNFKLRWRISPTRKKDIQNRTST